MHDAGVQTLLEKETYKMVWGSMVLMRGVHNRTLYKLIGSTITDGCNRFVVHEDGNKEDRTILSLKERQCYGIED